MFGGSGPFGNPFEHMQRQMQEMDNMMNSIMGNSFGMFGAPHPMILNGHNNQRAQRHHNPMDMMMTNAFGGFGGFGGLLNGRMQEIQQHAMNDPNSFVFQESTMISYDGNGQPKIVQSSTRKAGDVKETRHSVQRGDEAKLSIGHSIGDRSHIIDKKRDKDGRIRQQQRFVNLNEHEAGEFNNEFKTRASKFFTGDASGSRQQAIENGHHHHSRNGTKSISVGGTSSSSSKNAPIVTVPDDDDEEEVVHKNNLRSRGSRGRRNKEAVYLDDDGEEYVYANGRDGGPTIREISEEEADMSIPKRRKGLWGKFVHNDD